MSPRSRYSRTLMNKVIALMNQLGGDQVSTECNKLEEKFKRGMLGNIDLEVKI